MLQVMPVMLPAILRVQCEHGGYGEKGNREARVRHGMTQKRSTTCLGGCPGLFHASFQSVGWFLRVRMPQLQGAGLGLDDNGVGYMHCIFNRRHCGSEGCRILCGRAASHRATGRAGSSWDRWAAQSWKLHAIGSMCCRDAGSMVRKHLCCMDAAGMEPENGITWLFKPSQAPQPTEIKSPLRAKGAVAQCAIWLQLAALHSWLLWHTLAATPDTRRPGCAMFLTRSHAVHALWVGVQYLVATATITTFCCLSVT